MIGLPYPCYALPRQTTKTSGKSTRLFNIKSLITDKANLIVGMPKFYKNIQYNQIFDFYYWSRYFHYYHLIMISDD